MIEPKPVLRDVKRTKEDGPSRFQKVRMDRNERTHPFSSNLVERIRQRIDSDLLTTYPEPEPLYEKMAAFLHQPRDRFIFHTGSDLSIKSIFETYVSPGDKVLLHRPGYAMFSVYAKIFGAQVTYQFFDEQLHFDYEGYIAKIDKSYKMAVLENPNGFVGEAPPKKYLKGFIRKCEDENVLAIIDEAYFFFHEVTAADLLDQYQNLIVVRSFSKAFGLAGMRGGYLLSQNENIANLNKVKPMHELTGFTIMAITEVLNNPEEIYSFVKGTKEDLAFLKKGFADLCIETSPSVCNFVAARLGKYIPVIEVKNILDDENILIRRPFEEPHLHEWVRLGTAPIPYERKVLGVIQDALNKKK
ncbi:MAG: histidinol-phosphate transaminase [Methanoregula sp.]|nr:histidinol-phosphate transaminase [Methanoregula sp.]